MDEVTQQNSALVEENAATAKTLETQSKEMDDQVAKFVVEEGHQAQARAPIQIAARTRPVPVSALKRPAASSTDVRRNGPANRMQSQLATAVKQDEWQEF